jgi:hypothetical protein
MAIEEETVTYFSGQVSSDTIGAHYPACNFGCIRTQTIYSDKPENRPFHRPVRRIAGRCLAGKMRAPVS